MKNLLLILLASFALLFVLGQFGQGPESGQAPDHNVDPNIVDDIAQKAQSMINKAKQASTNHLPTSFENNIPTPSVPEDDQVEDSSEQPEQATGGDVEERSTPVASPIDIAGQNTRLAGDVPAPALGDVLSGGGAVAEANYPLAPSEPAGPVVHKDRHSIEEVIALSRDNASRFRRIHALINGD